MSDELNKNVKETLHQLVLEVFRARDSVHRFSYDRLDKYLAQIHQAYEDVGYMTKRKPVNHVFDCLYCGKHNERRLAPSQIKAGYDPKYCDQACRRAHTLALRKTAYKAAGLENV